MCQSGKNPFTQGIASFCLKPDFPFANCVVDHMQDKTKKSVHKIFPSPMLPLQATC
jgi:hypothetical protein